MRVHPSCFFYPLFFLSILATWSARASGWKGEPQLEMTYEEHEFLAACREGNVPAVEYYLGQDGFDPNANFKSGASGNMMFGLFLAAENGHDKVVRIFAQTEGIDLNQTKDGVTPLFMACQEGHDKVVKILAQTDGIHLNQAWNGVTPLFMASQQGHDKVVKILAQTEGIDLNQTWNGATSLYQASKNGHDKVVKILAQTDGIDLNQTKDGATPLFIASQEGHDKVVQILAQTEGIDLNQAWNGVTPLYRTSYDGHVKVVEILAQTAGIDLNQTCDGVTALFIASEEGHEQVVKILLEAGADPAIEWRYSFVFSKKPRTQARIMRPLFRRMNPEKYDIQTRIINDLKTAENNWGRKHILPLNYHNQTHYDSVSERIPLLNEMQRLYISAPSKL
ncbi:ankyrin repeat domain-containing protein [Sansalvadorimonas sp. 2012CJ34-2]|uniref:Ankyrin repeat domain-containing protein n=1 Tax=Parendozoicomonas callyspongiae TaxID=2942213 RepID=A0ABT0PHS9_9GAMM|nr:ankyrin repeat domain-containing protein [Sansalvadorimonas sp. 2012CJ34-2]MCL6270914.1 ankyrin repeat domain-containing protein [Sansalvadorimonas sp. 2012CJ34-2]